MIISKPISYPGKLTEIHWVHSSWKSIALTSYRLVTRLRPYLEVEHHSGEAVLVDVAAEVGVDPGHDVGQLDGALCRPSFLGQRPRRDHNEAVGGDALQHHTLDLGRNGV